MRGMNPVVLAVLLTLPLGASLAQTGEEASRFFQHVNVPGCINDDWDAGVALVRGGQRIAPYRSEPGWTGWAHHVTSHIQCERDLLGRDNDDLWIYWDHPFVANPANQNRIRVRYQGNNQACRQRIAGAGGAADYMDDSRPGSADNRFVPGRKPYLRLVIGFACIYEAHNIIIVWP